MKKIEKILVVGAGHMGRQIAFHCAAKSNCVVYLSDIDERSLESAQVFCRMEAAKRENSEEILGRLILLRGFTPENTAVDLVIETVTESLEKKWEVFKALDTLCPLDTILATNSSSICVSKIEVAVSEQRRVQVANMHFFPVIWERPMIELLGGTNTSSEVIFILREFASSIGLKPIIVQKENPGFVFNYVWQAIKRSCLELVDMGVASPEDIDAAWKIAMGIPVGPFVVMDMVGLDVVLAVFRNLNEKPPQVLLQMVAEGKLGRKTSVGFFQYPAA